MQTYEQALIETAARLDTAGSDTAKLDAILLLCEVVDKSKIQIYAHPHTSLTPEQYARFEAFVARREKAEPLAYILGRKGFWELDLAVSPDVLIPRPDTETLLDVVFEMFPQGQGQGQGKGHEPPQIPQKILELGVGSGAVVLSLLKAYPNAYGVATDISASALECAQKNAENLNLTGRLTFYQSHWFTELTPEKPFDVIVSNPPYVPTGDLAHLMRDVRLYEPHQALDGGADGLAAYRDIITKAPQFLKSGGVLALEVGQGQADDVAELLAQTDAFKHAQTKADLAGIKRVVFARAQ